MHQMNPGWPCRRWAGLLLLFVLMSSGAALAQQDPNEGKQPSPQENAATLDAIERELERDPVDQQLDRWPGEISQIKAAANLCVGRTEKALESAKQDIETLGPKVAGEDTAVSRKRSDLQSKLKQLEKELSSCRLLVLRSDELFDAVTKHRQEVMAERLMARGAPLDRLLKDNWDKAGAWYEATRRFVGQHSGIRLLSPVSWAGILTAGAIIYGLGLWARRRLIAYLRRGGGENSFGGAFRRALLSVIARYLPPFAATGVIALGVGATVPDDEAIPFVAFALFGLPFYFVLAGLVRLFLAPPAPAEPYLSVDRRVARAVARRLRMLALLLYLGYLLFLTLHGQSVPEPALLLTRALYALLLVLNLIWVVWLFRRLTGIEELNWFRAAVTLTLIAALTAEWAGYRNLSVYLLIGTVGTLIAIGVGLLLSRLFSDLYEGLDRGDRELFRHVRWRFRLAPGDPFPGITWIRFLTGLLIWTGVVLLILAAWGVAGGVLQQLRDFLVQGFTVGSLLVVPSRILLALLVIALVVPLSRWVRAVLQARWLRKTYLERGAREALVTITGYLIVAVAVLVALAIAGMDFSNLAIIAGALSVGIGFGLQNIVNNFVSGLILLFERPVKTGDWVVVGQTEGYVRRISIRSTQIQTFDRADVIVPNSELVSSQVTNWMLRDNTGRLAVPVGVAYGSDTQTVKKVLLEIAREHPDVVSDGTLPEPVVLFRRFGDSSLDFELRCFVQDVDRRLTITSDLNFAIDAAFRREGIEIPFPQRDLHLRGWPAEPPPATPDDPES